MDHQSRIETLRSVLRESQQAKANLERRLTEQRKKRRVKEAELSTVNGRMAQMKNHFAHKKEIRDVSNHKAEIFHLQANSLEHEIKKKREFLQKIEDDIQTFQDNGYLEVGNFEEELSCLAKKFKEARKEFTKTALTHKIQAEEERLNQTKLDEAQAEEIRFNTERYLKSSENEESTSSYWDPNQAHIGELMTDETAKLTQDLGTVMQELDISRNK